MAAVQNHDDHEGTVTLPAQEARRGRLSATGLMLKLEWAQPDQFDWITAFLRERGLLGSARLILASVASSAGMVPLTILLGQCRTSIGLLAAQLIGITLTTVMALYWWRRWPTRRQSQAAVLMGLGCIAVWSQAQPNAAMAAQICVAAAITGGYIGFLHSTKLLVLNFAVALIIDSLTTVRLARETDTVNAVGSFWLIIFMNLAVPLAIRGASRAIWIYATRSANDPLTGLLNRRAFTESLVAGIGDCPPAANLIVLLVDLDNFKRINDTYGHATGDRLLVAVSDVLREYLPGDATVCRAGGEEFLIATTIADHDTLATQLCTAIAALSPTVTASIGVTSVALHSAPRPITAGFIDQLVDTADRAMYAAKRNGGNHARQESHSLHRSQ